KYSTLGGMVKRRDSWFVPLYSGLYPAILCMARRYAGTWGVDADDLVQVAGLALWTCCSRYSTLPPDQQLRIGNTVARRTMLRWCDQEGRTPTHLGTAGSIPWFTVRSMCAEETSAEYS
ncbi:MAG: sigma factor, partial [Caldisericota bacterium]|nr:sigma factor [Caldisericota bacterium]